MRNTFPDPGGVLPLVPAIRAPYPRTRRRIPQPLPDAMAVRSVAVPDAAPPFDDHAGTAPDRTFGGRPATTSPAANDTMTAGDASSARAASSPGDAIAPGGTAIGREGAARSDAGRGTAAPSRAAAGGLWPSQFAQVLAEALAGARPQQQLNPWTSEQARRRISQLGNVLAAGQRPRVRRILVCCPQRDVLEMAVVVGFGPQVRALAVRLERAWPDAVAEDPAARDPVPGDPAAREHPAGQRSARWRCTAVDAA